LVKVIGVSQARIGSTRLPNKVLLKINDKALLEYHLVRLIKSTKVNKWIVATTNEQGSDEIVKIADTFHVSTFKGDTENVLNRFYEALKHENPDYVVRVTSDCPLIDANLIDEIVSYTIDNKLDYCKTSESYPDGFDVEVFKFSELEFANFNVKLVSDKEHVTPFIRRRSLEKKQEIFFDCTSDYKKIRLTVDEKEDFRTIQFLINKLGPNKSWIDYTQYVINNLTEFNNQSIIRNEGFLNSLKND
jgi:spore coat polysaccharide biosynthesis protein SpsF (cytidylyltransferase family)